MRPRDLFIDYCDIDDVHFFRVLNFDMFFAVKKGELLENETMARYLTKREMNGLRNHSISMEKLLRAPWRPLVNLEEPVSGLDIFLLLCKSYMIMSHHVSADDPLVLWYQNKAEAKEPLVMFILGKMYMSGKGVNFHPGKAIYWGIYSIACWVVSILKKLTVAKK